MRTREKEKIRQKLLSQRDELLQKLDANLEADMNQNPDGQDELDRAGQETERDLSHRLAEDEGNLLAKINQALERLEDGTYEFCSSCGEKIPLERLMAKPAASLCVSCQERKENGR